MRRDSILIAAAVVLLGGLAAYRLATAAPGSAPGADDPGIVGAWVVSVVREEFPSYNVLGTFDSGGNVLAANHPASPAGPDRLIYSSPGVGAWEATGPDRYVATVVVLHADGDGMPLSVETVRLDLVLDEGGEALSGTVTVVIADPAGQVLDTRTAPILGSRIAVLAPGIPAAGVLAAGAPGAPPAGTPGP